jgi:small neutral amino acid transporter SnatA (MarC family)
MSTTKANKVKLLGAVIGGGAVLTMGALAMSIHQQPAASQNRAVGQMTMAATTTASGKDDTVEATSMAVPTIKGPAPLPTEEAAAE